MPIKPEIKTLNANSVEILNTIRANAPQSYQDYVPRATNTTESIREIGSIIMSYQPLQNNFLKALVNRIGRVIITSKLYSNPWAMFKKGLLEYGETVEEIFVNLAKPHQFNPTVAETNLFKRDIPDVRAAFHSMNYQKFYKTTVTIDELRQAFLSWEGITDLIAKIVNALYTGANYDEFVMMKYIIARTALNGQFTPRTIPAVETTNLKSIVSTIKGVSNEMEFLKTSFNFSGVATYTLKSDQILIMNSKFDAEVDVEVLASAFNLNKAEFMGRRVVVDSFSEHDEVRLAKLFNNDATYKPFTPAELTKLTAIPCVLVDKDWFMVFDNYFNFTDTDNSEGLYWNYFYHTWKIFSSSPFSNAVIFTTETSAVSSVQVSPSTATVKAGSSIALTAIVGATGYAPKSVNWSVTTATSSTTYVTAEGVFYIGTDETADNFVVTATSTFDLSKSGSATITVG